MVRLIWVEWDINKVLSQEIPGDNSYQISYNIDKIYEHVAPADRLGFFIPAIGGAEKPFLLGAVRNIIKFGIYR